VEQTWRRQTLRLQAARRDVPRWGNADHQAKAPRPGESTSEIGPREQHLNPGLANPDTCRQTEVRKPGGATGGHRHQPPPGGVRVGTHRPAQPRPLLLRGVAWAPLRQSPEWAGGLDRCLHSPPPPRPSSTCGARPLSCPFSQHR